jgi:hypothetical protein
MAKQKERQTLISDPLLADTRRVAGMRKSAQTRPIPALPLGRRWPMARPMAPGAFLREPGAILGRGGAGPLHGKPELAALHVELGPPLGICQVAALIGCSPWTVRQTLVPRGLPFFRSAASGRLIFYTNQIVAWIESQQQKGGIATK